MRAATTTTDTTTAERQPLHWLTQTRTYGDGLTDRHSMPGHHTTAAGAQASRVARLRAAGTAYTSGLGWVEYREEPPAHVEPCTVRLVWSEVPPADGATFTPADLAAGVPPLAGCVVRVECDDTTGARVVADMTAARVVRLGCGCWRLEGDRPGPRVPDGCHGLHVLTGCGVHPSGILPTADPNGYGSAGAYAVGDRVGVRWGGTKSAGVVAEVHRAADDVVYTVNRPGLGAAYVGPEDMRPDTTPAPEVGQVWVCDSVGVTATVHGVRACGLIAETDRGSVILSAPFWRLADPAEVADVVPEPARVGVLADLLAARR